MTTNKQPQFPAPRLENAKSPFSDSDVAVGICKASSSSLLSGERSRPHSSGLCERGYFMIVHPLVGRYY